MSSILNATHSVSTNTAIPAHITKAQVLALLHNPEKMILLNPIVTSHHLLPPTHATSFFAHEPASLNPTPETPIPVYSVTEDSSIPTSAPDEPAGGTWRGGWASRFVPASITYETALRNTENGLVAITHAPMGVHSVTTWEVAGEEGKLVVEEVGTVRSSRVLMGFIRTTFQGSHEKLLKDFVARLEKDMELEREEIEKGI